MPTQILETKEFLTKLQIQFAKVALRVQISYIVPLDRFHALKTTGETFFA